MDPLSLPASIIAVLTLSATVVKYLNDIKEAKEERQSILNEVIQTAGFLRIFQDLAKDSQGWTTTMKLLVTPLEHFRSILMRLESQLRLVSGVTRVAKTLLWPFKKEEIKGILCAIERQKSLISLAVQNDHIGLSRAIENEIAILQVGVQELKVDVSQIKINQQNQMDHERDQYRQELLAWLSPLNFPVTQNDTFGR